MKFDTIKNVNYVATVVRIKEGDLVEVPGLDNLRGYRKFGMQALVSKDTEPGLYILFSTEVQLSDPFARFNNLYRDNTLNRDTDQKGYLEQNRCVKAIKLKGNRSDSLLMPLTSLAYMLLPATLMEFNEGDVFDSIDGQEICRKYVVREPKQNTGSQPKARVRRVDERVFPQHFDTASYFRNADGIPADAYVTVSQKLHGTSARFATIPVEVPQKWWERLLRMSKRTEYKLVVGTRRAVKSVDLEAEEGASHYYDSDVWTRYADQHRLADVIPKDFIIYGELVGWTGPGSPIQKNYTYDVPEGEARLYVYRVAMVSADGHLVDMGVTQMEQWCAERGLHTVPTFQVGPHHAFDSDDYLDMNYYKDWLSTSVNGDYPYRDQPVPLSGKKTVDEGVCVRWDGPHGPYVLKGKAPAFLAHESAQLDTGEVDLESAA